MGVIPDLKMTNRIATFFLLCLLVIIPFRAAAAASTGLRRNGGRALETNAIDKEPRIINGDEVREDRYPYFSLMYGLTMCGAVLIGPRLALGAAHCSGASSNLLIGAQEGISSGQQINILGAMVHPDHNMVFNSYDVVLFYLEQATDLPYIQLERAEVSKAGTKLTVLGFGDTDPDFDAAEISDRLMEVELEYVDSKTCDKMHGGYEEITEDMMCAAANNADSCGGDSGGPLVLKGSNITQDRLVGIVSWGRGCADKQYPGVYARISHVYDWIVQTSCSFFPLDTPEYMNCEILFGFSGAPTEGPTTVSSPFPSYEPQSFVTKAPAPGLSASPSQAPTVSNKSPTSDPSASPSEVPTFSTSQNVTVATTDFSNILELVTWTVTDVLLKACQGDCDSDGDCEAGLSCFSRNGEPDTMNVPGCILKSPIGGNVDVCYNASLANDQ